MRKILLTTITLFFTCIVFAQAPTNGLVAYYPFTGNASDLSGNGNNGTVNGATLTTDRFGNPNSAYAFDGVSSYITVPSSSSLNTFTNGQSLSFWMKIDSFPSDGKEHYMIDKTDASRFPYYQAFISNYGQVNNIVYRYGQTSTISSQGNNISFSTLPLHQWFNATFTTNLDTTWSYLNGVLVDTFVVSSPINASSNPLLLGTNSFPNSTNAPFAGYLDEIRIYNRQLTREEVASLINVGQYCYKLISVSDTLVISAITGINTLPQSFGYVKIYPNPAHDVLNVAVSSPSSSYTINIVNSIGTVVYSSTLSSSTSQINLSSLGSSGLYLIQITDGGNVLDTKKLLLE